jgi:hypothetical protein
MQIVLTALATIWIASTAAVFWMFRKEMRR